MSGGIATLQERVLGCLDPYVCLTIDQLDDLLDIDRRQISSGALGLIRRGYVERVERGCFKLTKAGVEAQVKGVTLNSGPISKHTGPRKVKKTTFRTRLWRALSVKDKFTRRDLLAIAANGSEKEPVSNVSQFVRALELAGYIRRLPVKEQGTAIQSNGYLRYIRLKHTGPFHPQVRVRKKEVYDPNTGEVFSWSK